MKEKADDVSNKEQPAKASSNAWLIAVWYTSSIISSKLTYVSELGFRIPLNVENGQIQLRYLGSAIRLSLFQQTFVSVAGTIMLLTTNSASIAGSSPLMKSKSGARFQPIVTLAIAMTLMSISYNSAMLYIPVSFLNTIKATIPLWTSIVCWFIQRRALSFLTQFSLISIVGGVGLASSTGTELGFHPIGFILAIFSAWNQTFFNIRAKSILMQELVTPLQLQVVTGVISATLLTFICIFSSAVLQYRVSEDAADVVTSSYDHSPIILLTLGGLNYFAELRLSYAAIGALGSLGYSVADVFRRLILICSAVILFGNPIKMANVVGVCIAMIGILLYNLSVVAVSPTSKTASDWALKKKSEPSPNSSSSAPTVLFSV